MSNLKAERQLKELRRLMPWCWDSRVEEHPPGEKAMHDFQDVLSNQFDQPRRRGGSKPQTPAAPPPAGPEEGKPGSAGGQAPQQQQRRAGERSGVKRASPAQPPLEDTKPGARGNKVARVDSAPAAVAAATEKAVPGSVARGQPSAVDGAEGPSPASQATPAVARLPASSPEVPASHCLLITPAPPPSSRRSVEAHPPSTCLPGSRPQAALTDYQLQPTPLPPSAGTRAAQGPQQQQLPPGGRAGAGARIPRAAAARGGARPQTFTQPQPQPQAQQPGKPPAAMAPTQNRNPNPAAAQQQQQRQQQALGAAMAVTLPPSQRAPAGPAAAAPRPSYAAALRRGLAISPVLGSGPFPAPVPPAGVQPPLALLPQQALAPPAGGEAARAGVAAEEAEEVSPRQAQVLSALDRMPELPTAGCPPGQALSLFQPTGVCRAKSTAALESLLAALQPAAGAGSEAGAAAAAAVGRSPSTSPPAACPPLFKAGSAIRTSGSEPTSLEDGEDVQPRRGVPAGKQGRTNLPQPPPSNPGAALRKTRRGRDGGRSPPEQPPAPAPRCSHAALSARKQQQVASASSGLHSRERELVAALLLAGCRMRSGGAARPKAQGPKPARVPKPVVMGAALSRALDLLVAG